MNNVYRLTMHFPPAVADNPKAAQAHAAATLRAALADQGLATQFGPVSTPDRETGQLAVVCTEAAALQISQMRNLGVESLALDPDRTHRRRQAYGC